MTSTYEKAAADLDSSTERARRIVDLVVKNGFLPIPTLSWEWAGGERNIVLKSPLHELTQTCTGLRDDLLVLKAFEGGEGAFVSALCALQPEARVLLTLRHLLTRIELELSLGLGIGSALYSVHDAVKPRALCAAARAGHASVVHELLTHPTTRHIFVLRRPTTRNMSVRSEASSSWNASFQDLFSFTHSPLVAACWLPSSATNIMTTHNASASGSGLSTIKHTNGHKVFEIVKFLLGSQLFKHARSAAGLYSNSAVIACIVQGHDAALQEILAFDPALATDAALSMAAGVLNLRAVRILLDASSRHLLSPSAILAVHLKPFREIPEAETVDILIHHIPGTQAFLNGMFGMFFHGAVHEAYKHAKRGLLHDDLNKSARGCEIFCAICSDASVLSRLTSVEVAKWVRLAAVFENMSSALSALLALPQFAPTILRQWLHTAISNAIKTDVPHIIATLLANASVLTVVLECDKKQKTRLFRLLTVCLRARTTRRLAQSTSLVQSAVDVALSVPAFGAVYDSFLRRQQEIQEHKATEDTLIYESELCSSTSTRKKVLAQRVKDMQSAKQQVSEEIMARIQEKKIIDQGALAGSKRGREKS